MSVVDVDQGRPDVRSRARDAAALFGTRTVAGDGPAPSLGTRVGGAACFFLSGKRVVPRIDGADPSMSGYDRN